MAIIVRRAERAEARMVPVSNIIVKGRYRADMGDLQPLADSIKAQGLLQPVGITERNELVFGERRLRACRDILGWTEIPARVVNVTSIIEAERDENEVRKDFTPSERVAIGQAIEIEIGKRQGKRTELGKNVSEVKGRTEDAAAKRAGFGNRTTYRQAKAVTETGVPALVEKMDAGEVSISAAAIIAKQPVETQELILSPKDQKKLDEAVRDLREAKEQNEIVRSMPDAEPVPEDERESIGRAVGTVTERGMVATILHVAETVAELPAPKEAVEETPPALEYAVNEEMPRLEAVSKWFDAFLAAWKAKEKTYDAA